MNQAIINKVAAGDDHEAAAVKAYYQDALQTEALKRSPFLMGKYVLGFERFGLPHLEWDRFARENLDPTCRRPGRVCVLQPRETYKTTFWTVTLAIWFLVNNPDASILITSSNEKNAVDMLRQIKSIFERCESFRNIFGDQVGPIWGQNEIVIKSRKGLNAKEGSILAVGRGTTITSKHFDLVIADDIVSSVDRDSAAERDNTLRYFQDLFDILKKDVGQMVITGTRWHRQDLYAHIVHMNLTGEKFKMLITPARNPNGSLNFPAILSEEKLKDLREVKVGKDGLDISQFHAQYMLDPLSSSEQIFKTFHYFDHSSEEYVNFVSFIDPALSVKTEACYSAIVTLARVKAGPHKNRWGLLVASIKKRTVTVLIEDIIRVHKEIAEKYKVVNGKEVTFPPHDMFIEDNGFQVLLGDEVTRKTLEGGYHLPLTGRTTTTKKETRIAGIEPAVTQGHILFRKDYNTAPDGYRLMLDQLLNFPQFEKDGPDALSLAWEQTRGRWMNT